MVSKKKIFKNQNHNLNEVLREDITKGRGIFKNFRSFKNYTEIFVLQFINT